LKTFFFLSLVFLASAQWKLVWSDEFDSTTCINGVPNSGNWGYEYGFVRNEELQWYQPDNAKCENGYLTITAEHLDPGLPNPNYDPTSSDWRYNRQYYNYTSSSLLTQYKHSWAYGKFETLIKIDIRSGSWPAFWTLGNNIDQVGWPDCGEIDIMEFYTGKTLANFCYGNDNNQQVWSSKTLAVDSTWASKFHNWTMQWDSQIINLYLDNTLMNSFTVANANTQKHPNPWAGLPLYLIANQAIGSTGGDPSKTTFPIVYQMDYVRVYQQ